jgi:hypothetical protein
MFTLFFPCFSLLKSLDLFMFHHETGCASVFGKVLLVAFGPSGSQNMVACSGVPVAFRTTSFAETWKIQFKIGKFSSVNSGFMRLWSCEECP